MSAKKPQAKKLIEVALPLDVINKAWASRSRFVTGTRARCICGGRGGRGGGEGGEEPAAAVLVAKLGSKAEIAREFAYRLYTLCERKKRAADALAYNGLVQSWPEITRLAREDGKPIETQGGLFEET